MFNITVMDQYNSAANVIVPANVSSIEINQLDNDTSILANTKYTIIVSAISDQGISYHGDPFVISKVKCNLTLYPHT